MADLINETLITLQNLPIEKSYTILEPIIFFTAGILIYSIFVFKFYRFLSRRDILRLDLQKYNTATHPGLKKFFAKIIYIIKYLIIFPLFAFFWFCVLALIFSILSKNHSIDKILLVSGSLVAAIRISAYYNEDLSVDLAKMIPFALLGIFLVDLDFVSFAGLPDKLMAFINYFEAMAYYLVFIILLEMILRFTTIFSKESV